MDAETAKMAINLVGRADIKGGDAPRVTQVLSQLQRIADGTAVVMMKDEYANLVANPPLAEKIASILESKASDATKLNRIVDIVLMPQAEAAQVEAQKH